MSLAMYLALVVLFMYLQAQCAHAWGWFGTSNAHKEEPSSEFSQTSFNVKQNVGHFATFDAETAILLGLNPRGKQLAEKSKSLMSEHSCWQNAYSGMQANCREILGEESKKVRLALRLTDCFLMVSGRPPTKPCPDNIHVLSCTKVLSDHTHSIFLAFFIDIASMCHYFQSQEFKLETEKLINELKGSAHWLEGKLHDMDMELGQTIRSHSEEILTAQKKLQHGHAILQEKIEVGMTTLQAAAKEAECQLEHVAQIQKEIAEKHQRLADSLAADLLTLQSKTVIVGDKVSNLANAMQDLMTESLAGQQQIFEGQQKAMESLINLHRVQTAAFDESRFSMQELTLEARKHQSDFHHWQQELDQMQSRLAQGSNAMLRSQELFITKQAAVFSTLDRLFSLHNSMLLESRALKSLSVYMVAAVFVFFATTSKRTENSRLSLYFGLLVTFMIEIWTTQFRGASNTEDQFGRNQRKAFWVRAVYGALATSYLVHTIITYRDYTSLSYNILREVQQKLSYIPLVSDDPVTCEACDIARLRRLTPYEKSLAKKIVQRARTTSRRRVKCT